MKGGLFILFFSYSTGKFIFLLHALFAASGDDERGKKKEGWCVGGGIVGGVALGAWRVARGAGAWRLARGAWRLALALETERERERERESSYVYIDTSIIDTSFINYTF